MQDPSAARRSITAEGLKNVYKKFNLAGDALVARLRTFRCHGVHVLGSFIFGLPTDRPARRARLVGRLCRPLFLGRPMPDLRPPA
jgi:hypothetical protein